MSLKPPRNLNFEGNVDENYKIWEQQYDIYALAAGVSEKAENIQVATFLHVAGPQAQQVYNSFEFNNVDDKDKIAAVGRASLAQLFKIKLD